MQITQYKSRLQQLISQRNGYLVLAAALAIISLILALSVCRLIGRERIVIAPPVVNQEFWVDAKAVSPEYLSQMTLFFVQLRLNLTPSNVTYQRETLLRYIDPSHYGDLKNELVAEGDRLEKTHTSLVFYPVSVSVDTPHLTADVQGDLNATVGNEPMPTQRVAYQLRYRYVQGRLWLQSFREIEEKNHV